MYDRIPDPNSFKKPKKGLIDCIRYTLHSKCYDEDDRIHDDFINSYKELFELYKSLIEKPTDAAELPTSKTDSERNICITSNPLIINTKAISTLLISVSKLYSDSDSTDGEPTRADKKRITKYLKGTINLIKIHDNEAIQQHKNNIKEARSTQRWSKIGSALCYITAALLAIAACSLMVLGCILAPLPPGAAGLMGAGYGLLALSTGIVWVKGISMSRTGSCDLATPMNEITGHEDVPLCSPL